MAAIGIIFIQAFDEKASKALLEYQWPGNLRQLKNVVKRATLLAQGEFITAKDLGEEINERKTVCENPEMEETFALHDEDDSGGDQAGRRRHRRQALLSAPLACQMS